MLFLGRFRYLLLSTLLLGGTVSAETKMPEVLADTDLPNSCKQRLIAVAEEIIGPKRHRIIENKVTDSNIFKAFMLLTYNDQESHINFTAVPTADGCKVSYSESFDIKTPCVDARESLFKRWRFLGKLSQTTTVFRYDYPRNKKELPENEDDRGIAYLTQTRRGTSCLVTKKQQNIQLPLKKDKE